MFLLIIIINDVQVTPIVTSALTNPELSLAATMALKDISRDCTDSMKPYAEQVSSLVPTRDSMKNILSAVKKYFVR